MSPAVLPACMAAITSAALTLRAWMLKPRLPAWCDAPRPVRFVLAAMGAAFGGIAVDLAHSPGAGVRETVAYTATAASALILLINMWRQRTPPPEPRS